MESSLISERVSAGMKAAAIRGKCLGRPKTPERLRKKIESLAINTNLSIRKIHAELDGSVSRSVIGEIVKDSRNSR